MAAEKSETPAAPETPEKKKGGLGALVPALLAIVLAPAATFAVAQFVLIPQLRKELAAPIAGEAAHAPAPAAEASGGSHGKKSSGHGAAVAPAAGYTFENIVVNLAGSMGTRYLKTSFLVTGDPNIKATFDEKKPVLVDVTINVLSSLSLADLEEPGSKNVIREKLVQSYNQTLGRKVAEQVFFSDFVVQ